MVLSFFVPHYKACSSKQAERRERIRSLPAVFHAPLTPTDADILSLSVSELVARTQAGELDPNATLVAYSKAALRAHEKLNCLTEVMILSAQTWAKECNRQGALAGVPISLKDSIGVQGWDSSVGYSARTNLPMAEDSTLVKLLRDAGAVPFVKTNIPITLLSFEGQNDIFGRTENPHKKGYSPGGSTSGEAALLAFGGSRIGIGTDVAGSVRLPSHYCGVYTIRAASGRVPKIGSATSIPGQEGVPPVCSPMARTLADLETVWKAIVGQQPWKYDHSCVAIPWRPVDLSHKPLKWGILWDDGVITPSPACRRALETVATALYRNGHIVQAIKPPSPYEGLKLAYQLIFADGGKTVNGPIRFLESNDPGLATATSILALPRWIKRIYAWYLRYIRRDDVSAGLIEALHEISVKEYWSTVSQREAYRKAWFDMWQKEELDFVLTVPNALPSVPHGRRTSTLTRYGYTFLFNLLDYTAGVLPITKVDPVHDELPSGFRARNGLESDAYSLYDAKEMAGLPVGIQVVGKRLEEEKVLEGMKLIEQLLRQDGVQYELLNNGYGRI